MKLKSIFLFFIVWMVSSAPLFAFTDKIAVPIAEVSQATQEVLSSSGIQKVSRDKKQFETKWVVDRVTRSRGLLKKVAQQVYERRYHLKVKLVEEYYATEVRIKGTFQERPLGSGPFAAWRTVKPDSADYETERNLFNKILKQLGDKRKKSGG